MEYQIVINSVFFPDVNVIKEGGYGGGGIGSGGSWANGGGGGAGGKS